jgi:hypothetical protein
LGVTLNDPRRRATVSNEAVMKAPASSSD